MSDAILHDDDLSADDLSPTQEYLIAGAVILLFGLLYWYLNRDTNIDPIPATPPTHITDSKLGKAGLGSGALGASAVTASAEGKADADATVQNTVTAKQSLQAPAATAVTNGTESTPDTAKPIEQSQEGQAELSKIKAEAARLEQETVRLQAETEAARKKAEADLAAQKAGIKELEAKDTPPVVVDESEMTQIVYALPDGTPIEIGISGVEAQLKKVLSKPTLNAPITFDNIYFNSGSTQVLASSNQQIKVVAALMNHYPERRILLRGHTDNTGNPASNEQLSLMRANAVALAISKLGISTDRMRILGAGQSAPIASNATESGRKKNRRIELFVVQ